MKLKPKDIDALKKLVNSDITQADEHYKDKIEPDYIKHQQIAISDRKLYDEMYPKLAETVSNISAFDLHDTINGIVPGIVRAVLGGDDVLRFKGFGAEDDAKAEKLQQLENWQIQEQNEGFLTIDQWIKDGCNFRIGVTKLTWKKEYEEQEFSQMLDVLSPNDQMMLQQLYSDEQVTKLKVDSSADTSLVGVTGKRKTLKENKPVFDNVPLNAIRWSPNTKNFYSTDFVGQINRTNADSVRRLAKANPDVFFDVEKAIAKAHGVDYTQYEQEIDEPNTFLVPLDDPRKEIEMWECYGKYDINDDGLLEDVILHVIEGEIIGAQLNDVGQHPFFVWSPDPDAYRVMPLIGLPDVVAETQHVKTALIKQSIHNIAVTNDPRHFIDENNVNLDDLAEGSRDVRVDVQPGGAIRNHVQPFPMESIHPMTIPLLQWLDGEKETHTGITKYSQGLDSKGLNDTATGINIITGQAQQKTEYMLRCFVELGMKPLARLLTKYNQMYIDQETVERLLNTDLEITMDDLDGRFDIQVSAGIGTGTKQQEQQNMMSLLGLYEKLIPAGIADITHAAFAFKKLIESLGYKNTDDFGFSPDEIKQKMQMQQAQQMQQQEAINGLIRQGPGGGGQFGGGGSGGQGIPLPIPGQAQNPTNPGNVQPYTIPNGGRF